MFAGRRAHLATPGRRQASTATILAGRYSTWVHHGPITRTVTDNALMLNVLAGPDTSDPTSLPADGVDYVTELNHDIKDWRIAYSPDLGYAEVDSEIASICRTAVQAFEDLGAHVTEAAPPPTSNAPAPGHNTVPNHGHARLA